MKRFKSLRWISLLAVTTVFVGCEPKAAEKAGAGADSKAKPGAAPKFLLAWSEYPSWSIFGVASDVGLIDGEPGKMGLDRKEVQR